MAYEPLVSIIVPCYNYGAFLSEALDSLIAQTYQNWECIIVDDGSTDNTIEVCATYVKRDARINFIHQANLGLAGARNTALRKIKGQYIQLLDADDKLESNKLALQVMLLESNPCIDLIYSNILLFNHFDRTIPLTPFIFEIKPVSGNGEILIRNLLVDNFFLPGCTIFRRSMFEKVGYFRVGMSGLEDWNYWYRAALLGCEFYNDTRPGTHLLARDHGNNMSTIRKNMWFSKIKAREDILAYIKQLQTQKQLKLSDDSVKEISKIHNNLLLKDKARYSLYFDSISAGLMQTLQYVLRTGNVYDGVYDAAYWIKERIKK